MKARIIKHSDNFWYGEVYGTWTIPLLGTEWTGWHAVTPNCFTKLGAKFELAKWRHENVPDEFDI